jgi:hypothetical protein
MRAVSWTGIDGDGFGEGVQSFLEFTDRAVHDAHIRQYVGVIWVDGQRPAIGLNGFRRLVRIEIKVPNVIQALPSCGFVATRSEYIWI